MFICCGNKQTTGTLSGTEGTRMHQTIHMRNIDIHYGLMHHIYKRAIGTEISKSNKDLEELPEPGLKWVC